MTSDNETATLGDYWAILRRRWLTIAIAAILGAVGAGAYVMTAPAQYSARASLIIKSIQSDPFATTRSEDVGATTERAILASTVVADRAARKLESSGSRTLLEHLTVENPLDTLILDVTFTAGTARAAQVGAQAFADSYLEYRESAAKQSRARKVAQIDAQLTTLRSEQAQIAATIAAEGSGLAAAEARRSVLSARIGDLDLSRAETSALDTTPGHIIQPAQLPQSPDGPGIVVTVLGGGALGLLLGSVVALTRSRGDRRLLGAREVEELLANEQLVMVPSAGRRRAGSVAPGVASAHHPDGAAAEQFRRIRLELWPQRGQGPRRVLVVAPNTRNASDEVAANLAVALGAAGWQTMLAWTDRVDLPTQFSLPSGVIEASQAADNLVDQMLEIAELPNVSLLPAFANSNGTTDVDRAGEECDELDGLVDVQLIATDAILSSSTCADLASLVDGFVIAFDVNTTQREDLGRAIQTLRSFGKVLAVVATNVGKNW